MNPSKEQDQTANNVFIEGELSEEDLKQIAGALRVIGVINSYGVKSTITIDD